MLNYNQQYNISHGIFLTYDQELDKPLYSSKHGKEVRDKMKGVFPYKKYESIQRSTFILSCIYIMFNKSPSSYRSLLNELRDLDLKHVENFKNEILNYETYLKKDINYLQQQFVQPSIQDCLREFVDKNIRFYTLWFFILYKDNITFDKLKESRVYRHIHKKLSFIMLFMSFKTESIEGVTKLLKNLDL